MKKMYVMIACLCCISFYSSAQECSTQALSAFCKLEKKLDDLINSVDLNQFKSQQTLEAYSHEACVVSTLHTATNTNSNLIVKAVCLNKFSIAWMQNIRGLNNLKIDRLDQEISENNASLTRMNELIETKKAEIKQLKQ
ncbi:MAG: hypothetical protein HRU38_10460 [Saccharospirillaceae bacterium]|nr:hypothetical protein [Pseudomonadales bacterium]NRB79075.1 hypothetical protein [Saccharospirillaceae bacterium]